MLRAAQRANAAVIIEIAKSEGGAAAYCAVSSWSLATLVDVCANALGVRVPVAVHADHYGIKGDADVEKARIEIPSMFDAGTTSIAIDASHMPDDKNLLASIELNKYVPAWAGLETEQGEIMGKEGLSNKEEAVFLIAGLNAHGISPEWIALNKGTTHGIEASDAGIQVGLTAEIHDAIAQYKFIFSLPFSPKIWKFRKNFCVSILHTDKPTNNRTYPVTHIRQWNRRAWVCGDGASSRYSIGRLRTTTSWYTLV